MVKFFLSIILSFSALLGISFYETYYVESVFNEFSSEVDGLYQKTLEKTAGRDDAEALRLSWADKKSNLHIWVPHNDISYLDYWLSEGLSYIETENYDDALSKLEVLKEICKNIPPAYVFSLENIL